MSIIPSKVTPQTFPFNQSIKKIYHPENLYTDHTWSEWYSYPLYSRVTYETRGQNFTPHIFPQSGYIKGEPPVFFNDTNAPYTSLSNDTVVYIATDTMENVVKDFDNKDDYRYALFRGYDTLFNTFLNPTTSVQDMLNTCFIDITDDKTTLARYMKSMQIPDILNRAGDPGTISFYEGARTTGRYTQMSVSLLIDRGKGYEQAFMYPYIGAGYNRAYTSDQMFLTVSEFNKDSIIQIANMPFFDSQYNPYKDISDVTTDDIQTILIYNPYTTTNNWLICPIAKLVTIAKPLQELNFACTNDFNKISDPNFQSSGEYGQLSVKFIRSDNSNSSNMTPTDTITTPYQSSMLTIYNPTLTNIQEIGDYLWTDSFIERLKKLYNDPKEALISLHKIPYMPKHNASAVNVTVCGAVVSETPCAVITDPIDEIDCGSIELNAYFGSFLDFSPYTKIRLYLPFCGEVTLNPEECINSTLTLKYSCNCLTGECLAQLHITRTAGDSPQGIALDNILYQKEGYMAFPYPLSSADYSRRTAALVQLGIGIGETAVGALTGAMPIAGRGIRDTLGAGADVATSKPSYSYKMSSGGLGFLGVRTPYLQVIRPNTAVPSTYGAQHGFMAQISGAVGDFVGYTEIADVHLDYVNCLGDEKEEIERLLKAGVIL